jgi:hypothetical protein
MEREKMIERVSRKNTVWSEEENVRTKQHEISR